MAYICEQELKNIYKQLEPKLHASGLQSEIALVRDYLLKLMISENGANLGKLIVDYSPKKQSHSFRKDSDLSEEQFARVLSSIGAEQPKRSVPEQPSQPKTKTVQLQDYRDVSGIRYKAYVDGSFIQNSVGYGAVILDGEVVAAEIFGAVDRPDAFQSRQVGGEIQAVIEVLEWCKKNSVDEIAIFYDFQNIEKWATGQYRANTPMTMEYKQYIDRCKIAITWVKVQSHTGIELNDRADELAKKGAQQLGQMSMQEIVQPRSLKGWIIFNASLITPKFMEQVEWFQRSAQKQGIELIEVRNDQACAAIISGNSQVLDQKGLEKPDFVLFWDKDVRLARQIEKIGIRVFNSSQAIASCDDKTLTHQVLSDSGIPMPKTIIAPLVFPNCPVDESVFVPLIEKELRYPLVVKEAFGSFGAQVYLANNRDELVSLRKRLISTPHLYQEYLSSSHGRDVRLQVVGDEVVASMLRTSDTDFRANISAGGHMLQFIPPKSFQELAVKAAKLIGADFAGVDILFGKDEEPILCEVNSNAHMKNIYECTGVDVAAKIVQYIKKKLEAEN